MKFHQKMFCKMQLVIYYSIYYRKAYDYFNYSEKLEEDDENEFWIGILIYAGFGDSTLHEDEADKWLKKSKENGNVTAEECLNDEKTKMKFVNKFIE